MCVCVCVCVCVYVCVCVTYVFRVGLIEVILSATSSPQLALAASERDNIFIYYITFMHIFAYALKAWVKAADSHSR